METKQGEIQNIRKDKKGIEIENIWYSSNFKPIELNKGDLVEVEYQTKGKFNNIKSIKKLDHPAKARLSQEFDKAIEPDWAKEIDSNYEESKFKEKNPQIINTILMQSIQYAHNHGIDLDESTKEVLKSYKLIRDSI